VRLLGAPLGGGGPVSAVTLAVLSIFVPAAVLSAVSPTVVKLQLRDLRVTGEVVGRFSALATAGAIAGTFLAGFVLVEAVPTTVSILVVGAGLTVAGIVLWVVLAGTTVRVVLVAGGLAVLTTGAGVAVGDPCDVETVYHCAQILVDPDRPSGRVLVLDRIRNSYVELDDPTHLEMRYSKVFADVVAAALPSGRLDALHIGGGGFTLPRFLGAVRPGTSNLVLEIDPGLVELSRTHLGLRATDGLDIRVGDGRLALPSLPKAAYDVVLGDAFSGLAVPWHLTTAEFLEMVRAVLRPDGIYVVNLIDYPPLRFVGAQAATLGKVFGHVAVIAPPDLLAGEGPGNFVLVAGSRPLLADAVALRIAARGGTEQVLADASAAPFADGAPVLTDDHAPVDQWLARSRLAGGLRDG
jgi:spermidine synthase